MPNVFTDTETFVPCASCGHMEAGFDMIWDDDDQVYCSRECYNNALHFIQGSTVNYNFEDEMFGWEGEELGAPYMEDYKKWIA